MRRRAYWNYILNRNKAKLYQRWIKDNSEFLPRKFRPKFVKNENQKITDGRIREAHGKYTNNVTTMGTFETIHFEKYRSCDEYMIRVASIFESVFQGFFKVFKVLFYIFQGPLTQNSRFFQGPFGK